MNTAPIIPVPSKNNTKLNQEACKPAGFQNEGHPATPPTVTGQCAQVLSLIREHGPILSFTLTADYAIPEAAARIHDLRRKGFNIVSTIIPEVVFRGQTRKRVALYSLGSPEWGPTDAL